MSRQEHPIWEEELMPYVDGQLDAVKASDIAEHLKTCEDCASVVADAHGLSRQMTAWQVEESPDQIRKGVLAELRTKKAKQLGQGWPRRTSRRAWTYGLSGAVAALVLAVVFVPSLLRSRQAQDPIVASLNVATVEESGRAAGAQLRPLDAEFSRPAAAAPSQVQGQAGQQGQQVSQGIDTTSGPMIIRSAHLMIITKEFESSRARIESIVQQSQGYLDQLTVRGEAGSGRALSASLRLPSNRIDSGLVELRKLGRVREESQNSSDVTSQIVDLRARLANARNTEQRLLALQRERTDKLPDVVNVEREISRVREEIERMEAQQKDMTNKVQFATIQLEMSEEYHAEIQTTLPSAATRLWNASIEGYHAATESVMGMALFFLRYGPMLLLWAMVLTPVVLLLRRRFQGARLT
jgi:hypothetical protein